MNIRIIKIGAMTRGEIIKTVCRWVIYVLLLIIFFAIECNIPFLRWQPLLCVTLACAVSFFEGELSGFIFAAVCGMFQDLAMGSLFGFTSIWLSPCCLMATLLVVNLIHRNMLNFIWINAAVLIIVEIMELFFKFVIWRNPHIDLVLLEYMLPALIATIVLSVPIYFIVKKINRLLGLDASDSEIIGTFADIEGDDDK